ncbi:MAG: hypothetical protein MR466_01220 [Ruminococcus sp.]|nr:hypothetical protein [Ruminococcus sp.]
MELSVFMDETSRSGQQRYSNGDWNFKNQPYFGLGALYIPSESKEYIYQELTSIIDNSKVQGEFKWSNRSAQNKIEKLFPNIMNVINNSEAKLHFEIEDKRFTIAKVITEYCVLPFYNIEPENLLAPKTKYIKMAVASYIADNLSDHFLWEICSFFDSGEYNTEKLKYLIKNIIKDLNSKVIRKYCLEVIDLIEKVEKRQSNISIKNLFPVKDTIQHNGVKSNLTIDPHTDCFADLLLNSIAYFPQYKTIKCVHDAQDQWEPALKETIDRINTCSDYSFSLITKPGFHTIINIVDYISGYLNKSLKLLFDANKPLPENLKTICDSHFTLVASVSFQEKIWPSGCDQIVTRHLYNMIREK